MFSVIYILIIKQIKNNNKILIGLIIESANNPFTTSLKETQLKIKIKIAPIKQTI